MNSILYNVVVPNKNLLTGIVLSSYGFSEPLKNLKRLKSVIDVNELKSNYKLYKNYNNIVTGLPPWKNLNPETISTLISCFVVESTMLFPEQEDHLTLCKKIWVPTSFCQNILQKYCLQSDIIPYCLETPKRKRIPEKDETFTFLMSFDGKYSYERKGILEGIRAFKKAFSQKNVMLKIKTFDLKKSTEDAIIKEISGDTRIYIDKEKLKDFEQIYDNVSCYLSPHKGEGFGRHIAESMYRELPTIVTNYGGPTDFCDAQNCFLIQKGSFVRHDKLCPQYNYTGEWFAPNEEEIAERMLEAYETPKVNKIFMCKNAKKTIVEKYSKLSVQNLLKSKI